LATPQRVTGKPSNQEKGTKFSAHCNTFCVWCLPCDNIFFAGLRDFLEQGQGSGLVLRSCKYTGTRAGHANRDV